MASDDVERLCLVDTQRCITPKLSDRENDMGKHRKAYPGSLERSVVLLLSLETELKQMENRRKAVWIEAGEEMRRVREASKLSLRETAKRLGISAPFLSDMELGRRHPSVNWLRKLEEVLKQHNI
jgi:ribosome-binding protein aMBF1 (putative translation factor)